MKKVVPEDFIYIFETFRSENKLSVNSLRHHYNVSPQIISRWLEDCNLYIEKNNTKYEDKIDMGEFKKDALSGEFTLKELSDKYQVRPKQLADRNDIELKLKSNKFEPTSRESFIKSIETNGKMQTARDYGITLAVVNGWCKRNNLEVEKYLGLKRNDVDEHSIDIIKMYNSGHSTSELAKYFFTSIPKIKRVLKENGISLRKNQFDLWKEDRIFIKDNIEKFIAENKNGKTLMEIAQNYSISYEVLKSEFKHSGIGLKIYSQNKSRGELELKDFLNSLGFECHSVKMKHQDICFEIDCYVEELKIGFEYCGEYWHSVNSGKPRLYHQKKYLWAEEQGIRLITIFEHEWRNKNELIKDMIRVRLGIVQNKVYARKTEVSILSNNQARLFHEDNHINGGLRTSSINLGLFHDSKLLAAASFSKSRFDKNVDFELLRFSTERSFLIVGGFSKLLKKFVELNPDSTIVSYCDLRFGTGLVYEKSGFDLISVTPPNYWYFYKFDTNIGLESRIKYQKHKLKMFSNFSDDKTEYEIMAENNYLKIYDCGNKKYVYDKNGA